MRRWYHRLPVPPSTNYNLDQLGLDPYDLVPAGGIVLDIGCGSNGPRYAFTSPDPTTRSFRIIGIDITSSCGVAVLADAHALPVASQSIDAVVCVSVLEYVQEPFTVVREIHRVLRPGGVVYLSAPFVFPDHAPPDDLYRFSPNGIRSLARDFDEIRVGSNRGPASAFCHVLVHFLAISLSFNSRPVYGVLVDVFRWGLFWIKYLDRWIGNYEMAAKLYGNAFFLGRKPLAAS